MGCAAQRVSVFRVTAANQSHL